MGGSWQLWLGSAVIAAIVGGLMNLPKVRGEGRKSLADAQEIAQRTALASANAAYDQVNARCQACKDALDDIGAALETVLNAAEHVIDALRREHLDAELIDDLEASIQGAERELRRHR